jgi:hypothetical protein
MIGKRTLLVAGLVAALAVPSGVALAAGGATPTPGPGAANGQGYGPGQRGMMGGYGDPEDCPFHDTAAAQQWRDQREERQQLSFEERQKLVQEHRAQMQQLRGTTSPSS